LRNQRFLVFYRIPLQQGLKQKRKMDPTVGNMYEHYRTACPKTKGKRDAGPIEDDGVRMYAIYMPHGFYAGLFQVTVKTRRGWAYAVWLYRKPVTIQPHNKTKPSLLFISLGIRSYPSQK
jgi:hypothetical protein